MTKFLKNPASIYIFASIIFLTLLFPAIRQFVAVFISKPASESLFLWTIYSILLMLSCFGLINCVVQTQRTMKLEKPKEEQKDKILQNNNNKEELKRKLSETESALRNVIANLTNIISEIKTGMEERDSSLIVHKEKIAKATTLQDYVKIGEVLVSEISNIIETNKNFKEKLKNADEIIKEQNDNLAKLVTETMTDHLTTVLNKRGFEKRLDEEYIRHKRYDGKLSMITLDLDNFKEINDSYGHLFGDKSLRGFAQLLKKNIREADVIARVGGEEFSILLPETDLQGAFNAAQKIHELLNTSVIKINGDRIKLTASFGVSTLKKGETPLSFMDRADQALYLSKKIGRNHISTEEELE